MSSNLILNCLWLASTALHLGIILQLLRCGLTKKWPSLLAFCSTNAIGSAVLWSQMGIYNRYFCVFWVREALLAAIRIWVVVDVARAIPSHRFIPAGTRVATLAGAVTLGAVAGYVGQRGGQGSNLALPVFFNQCVTIAWAGALSGFIVGLFMSGFGVYLQSVRIAAGYITLIATGMLASVIYNSSLPPRLKLYTNEATGVVAVAVLCYWFFSLCIPDSFDDLTPAQDEELRNLMGARHPLSEDLRPHS